MQPSICKKHFREVANYFDKETALAYALDDKQCVICHKVIYVEGARRLAQGGHTPTPSADDSLRLPDAFSRLGA